VIETSSESKTATALGEGSIQIQPLSTGNIPTYLLIVVAQNHVHFLVSVRCFPLLFTLFGAYVLSFMRQISWNGTAGYLI
jgi:hypothetical protein